MFRAAFILLALVFFRTATAGAGLDQLHSFNNDLESFSADFEQTVYDAKSRPVQESSGTVTLKRPGRFAWNYKEPAPQLIVADGSKIWIYDQELAQVTVKPLDESLGAAPIMLLGDDKPLESAFDIKELGESDGINWLELKPKNQEADFEAVFMGLNKTGLVAMELRDNFGQATQIKFSASVVNQPVDESLFQFSPPEGVDVVGQ